MNSRAKKQKLESIECSKYECYWRMGYGPPGGDKMDEAGWIKYFCEMNPAEYQRIVSLVCNLKQETDLYPNQELWDKYQQQIHETEGFDIDIYPADAFDASPVSAETYIMLSDCSRMAVDAYNQLAGTNYTLNRVVKVCAQAVAGFMYYITFVAMESEYHPQLFQAKVYAPPKNKAKELVLVRRKAMGGMPSDKHSNMMTDLYTPPCDFYSTPKLWETYLKQIKESEGFDIDVYPTNGCGVIQPMFNDMKPVSAETYNMLSGCSSMAVDAYNVREGTDYTVNRVVKACAQTVGWRMYYITFEAINSENHLHIFQAKVFEHANGKKVFLLVRRKLGFY